MDEMHDRSNHLGAIRAMESTSLLSSSGCVLHYNTANMLVMHFVVAFVFVLVLVADDAFVVVMTRMVVVGVAVG